MTIKKIIIICFFSLVLIPLQFVFAQEAGQAGKVRTSEEQLIKEKQLRQRIEKEKIKSPVEETKPEEQKLPITSQEKVTLKQINIVGVTQLLLSDVTAITDSYLNKEIMLSDMQQMVGSITDLYRTRGFITSRAYLPPQKIENNVLEIKIIEGVVGAIEIKGNRFFREAQMRKYVKCKSGEVFNLTKLRSDISVINAMPDRNVKTVLAPGKEFGKTDILLEVKDRLPLHAELVWDNYGSRFIRKNHYTASVTHNNLLGFDDIFSAQYQLADGEDYQRIVLRYLFPVTTKFKIGAFWLRSKLALGREYRDVMARGKSQMYSVYGLYDLINEENFTLGTNFGFDYKDSFNFQLGDEESRDRLRIFKIGLDADYSDKLNGRTILSPEMDFGIPDIIGGLDSQDRRASRSGAGGKFVKTVINALRLQQMPFDSSILWKNQMQISPYILTSTEQMQLGGIENNRGYPAGEYVGDQGYTSSIEVNLPFYGIPKDVRVPFSKQTVYDNLKWLIFYDYGFVKLRRPQAGEEKTKTLRSAGCGLRFGLPDNFSIRVDFGWPLDKTPSDGRHFHPWVEVSKVF